VSRRKGNRILVVYDMKLKLSWEGQLPGCEEKVMGTICIDEVASTSDEDDYMFEFLVDGAPAPAKEQARALVAAHARPQIVKALQALAEELKRPQWD